VQKVRMLSMLTLAGIILFFHLQNTRASTPQEKSRVKPQPKQSGKATMKNEAMNNEKKDEAAFMCRLDALDAAERVRYQAVRKQLHAGVQEVKELPDGYAFRLSADSSTIMTVAEWMTFERRCCPFFNFALAVESEKASLWLRITGREGVKSFMQLELGVR
jgi:hypothetical protein